MASNNAPPPLLDEEEDEEELDAVPEKEEEAELNENDSEVIEETRKIVDKMRKSGDEVTLMDEMAAAARAAKIVKERRAAKERIASEKEFGAGLKAVMQANLEKRKEKAVVIEALKAQGNDALKSGDLKRAVELYSKAIAQCGSEKKGESWFESEPALRTNRAQTYFKLESYKKCVDDCEAALKIERKWAKGYLWKARALAKLNSSSQGGMCLEKGIDTLGKKTKDGAFLLKEFKTLFPNEYDMYCMPIIGKKDTSKADAKKNLLEPTGSVDNIENIAQKQNEKKKLGGLEFDEVREAMQTLEQGEWANNDFAKQIAENPILAKGMADPRSAVLLQKLTQDPVSAMKEYGTSPEAREFIMEMMKVLGSHFTKMGEESEKASSKPMVEPPQIIPEKEAKLQREVDKALSNDEIRKLLEDPETHKVLQQCGNPAMLNKYMQDPVWGARIRFMIDNGLVKLER